MKHNLILKLLNGQERPALLASPFKPQDNRIVVRFALGGDPTSYSLQEVCCILILGNQQDQLPPHREAATETVETTTGELFQVHILGKQTFSTGFFGFPVAADVPFKAVFFTFHGIRLSRQERPLGEILIEKGLVQESVIQDVLNEQENLRNRRVGEIIAEKTHLPQATVDQTIKAAAQGEKKHQIVRVGDILIAAGLVSREQVEEALASQQTGKKKRVGTLLVEHGLITENQLLTALATKFRMRFVDLQRLKPTPAALKALPKDLVYRMQVFPLDLQDKTLTVATSAPTDPTVGDSLRFSTNVNIELVVASSKQIAEAIEKYYEHAEDSVESLIGEMKGEEVAVDDEPLDTLFSESDSHVINLVNKILLDAHSKGVSDIHFEPGPGKKPFRIRYRVDGECFVAHQISATYKSAIISRIKIISQLDIAERRKPQSGKIQLKTRNRKLEYRVEITPTVGGCEDAVLRVLGSSKPLPLHDMGFTPTNLRAFDDILAQPYGIVLCVGPTGSGKTTTLHSALGHINTPGRKIWTAEDPVEITQSGLRQVQVNPKIGFSFQEALRSFLRADPDVIMIGEMRDPETAKIAIEASLTGHLVFSTLHTNSAPETVVRLVEMGMDPFNFADALLGVLAQRLARKLCTHCKQPYHPSPAEYDELVQAYGAESYAQHQLPEYAEDLSWMRMRGCEKCSGGGYQGRVPLHELLVGTPLVKEAIKKNAMVEELRALAIREGMRTLKMDGIQKVMQGLTDMEQVMKVCI